MHSAHPDVPTRYGTSTMVRPIVSDSPSHRGPLPSVTLSDLTRAALSRRTSPLPEIREERDHLAITMGWLASHPRHRLRMSASGPLAGISLLSFPIAPDTAQSIAAVPQVLLLPFVAAQWLDESSADTTHEVATLWRLTGTGRAGLLREGWLIP